MALEVLAIVSFGLSTLGVLTKIYHHFDHRFDEVDKHVGRLDKEVLILGNKIDSIDTKYAYRIESLERDIQRFTPPRSGT